MTWFETEQIVQYINRLEVTLDDWTMDRMEMCSEAVEANRINQKLNREIAGDPNSSKGSLYRRLSERLCQCVHCINERLKC